MVVQRRGATFVALRANPLALELHEMSVTKPSRRRARPVSLIRRLWIVPVSMVVVAAIGYAVAGLQSSSYSASSTVVVTSAPGAVQAASASNSGALAATYAGALPNDPVLQGYIGRTAHVPTTTRRHVSAITALPSQGSTITLQFNARTPAAAVAGARAIGAALSQRTPVSSVATPGTVNVVSSPSVAAGRGQRWHAQVILVVPSQTGPTEGINPSDAQHLATTYAALVTTDDRLLSAVGGATGQSSSTVSQNLSVVNQQNTSLLDISYRASNPRLAAIGAAKAANAISGPRPLAAGIVPSSVQLVSVPVTPAAATATSSSTKPVAIGAVLGLLLGIVLLIAWERSDPRIGDARALSAQLGCPATPGERLTRDAARALLERWRSLTDAVPARVAVLPADRRAAPDAEAMINLLVEAGDGEVGYFDARSGVLPEHVTGNGNGGSRVGVLLVNPGPADSDDPGEAVALSCDLTVVVVQKSARATEVRRLAQELGNFGIVPTWALLTRPGQPADIRRVPEGALSS